MIAKNPLAANMASAVAHRTIRQILPAVWTSRLGAIIPIPIFEGLFSDLDMVQLIIGQGNHVIPKLVFRQVCFHVVDQRGRDYHLARIVRDPMVKNTVPRAMRIKHLKRHLGVVTDKAIFTDIAQNSPDSLTRETL